MKKWTLRTSGPAARLGRARATRGRVWLAAATILAATAAARAADAVARLDADVSRIGSPSWAEQSNSARPAVVPTTRPSFNPPRMEVIRDPLPPAVWSGGSMFALGGAFAAARNLRRRLRFRTSSDVRFGSR